MRLEPLPERRFKVVKVAIAFLFVFVLMCVGYEGRQHVGLQMRLEEITLVRDQLQQELDDEQRPTDQLIGGVQGATKDASQAPSSTEQKASINILKTRLTQFDSDYHPSELSELESLELRLSKATLAIVEQRFTDALTLITDQDEKEKSARTEAQISGLVHVLEIRGDSLYGLHKLREALDRYRQILNLQPNRTVTIARVADCHYVLGALNDALITYGELAKNHNNRGNAFLVQGKLGAAIDHYQKAIEIENWLIEKEGRSELTNELAMSHNDRGNAFLIQGKLDAAIDQYQKAIEIQARLLEHEVRSDLANELAISHNNLGNALLAKGKPGAALGPYQKAIEIRIRLLAEGGRGELANELAMSHNNLGNCFLSQRKLDAAIGQYQQAIEIQTRLFAQQARGEWANALAMSYNNRGVVRRAQGKVDAAIGDFDNAIRILSRPVQQQAMTEARIIHSDQGVVGRAQVRLDVATGYSDKAVEVLPRTRLIGQGVPRVVAVVLAMSLKSRGYAYLAQGKPDAAVEDFKKAVEIYARLVNQEGQRDLVLEFAKSLNPLAWIYATNPDNSFRNGSEAKQYALAACELSGWKAFVPVETLAAACAETGSFSDAVKWQEKAIELAPGEHKLSLRSKLELYKSGNPYRASLPKGD